MKRIVFKTLTRTQRRFAVLSILILVPIAALICAFEYIDYETSIAVVRGGSAPAMAAADLPAFRALFGKSEKLSALRVRRKGIHDSRTGPFYGY